MFVSTEGEDFDADAGRHRAEHLGLFQVDNCRSAGIVVGGQHGTAVRVKGHVHRPSAELQEFLQVISSDGAL
jgi:hypothetical protein